MSSRPTILLFGDSITQYAHSGGWGTILQQHYQRKADILNRGYSGYNTRMAKAMTTNLFPPTSTPVSSSSINDMYVFTTLFFGANDAADNEYATELQKPPQGISVEEYKDNLLAIIERMQHYTSFILLISPPPVDNQQWKDRNNDRVVKYSQVCEEITQDIQKKALPRILPSVSVIHINLYDRMMINNSSDGKKNSGTTDTTTISVDDDYKIYFNDGLHLSSEGDKLVANAILETLQKYAPHCTPDALPLDFDIWRDIDPQNVEKYFSKEHLQTLHSTPTPFRK